MDRGRGAALIVAFVFVSTAIAAQTTNTPAATTTAPTAPSAEAGSQSPQAFIQAADQVMAEMSKILDLPILDPLKKSLRSKEQIRAYLVQEEKDDRTDAERYADHKALEAFGLVPKGFPLDSFMLNVMTDQVAGLYDPKAKEFYIASWISIEDQKPVMAHELTHALEDQSFNIEKWIKSARPNDDAEMARDSVSEGSAMAAMVDYSLEPDHVTVRALPDVSGLIRTHAVGEMDKDPNLSKAPSFIRDELLFPYLAGVSFTQEFLKAHTGWSDLKLLFENPPASTQQIMHPDLYLKGVKPVAVSLPDWKGIAPADWTLLEENVLGEFGLDEVLKDYLGQARADSLSSAWAGDRYAVFEDQKTKGTSLVFRLALDNAEDAAGFYTQYGEALGLKYKQRTDVFNQSEYLQFDADGASVFLRCVETTCLTVEGTTRATYDDITRAIGWTPAPSPLAARAKPVETSSFSAIPGASAVN
ncbi:MAG TPA: hypothetical protein VGR36_01710 [Candidatus Acidoferrales bacterium]|nr:hypothetical protein [Candidatus Acidoferrales bacterium]